MSLEKIVDRFFKKDATTSKGATGMDRVSYRDTLQAIR